MGSRISRRVIGQVNNIANQVAQIATGFNAISDGPVLLAEQATSGRYVIDAIKGVAVVNGHDVELGMAHVLAQWIEGELQRLGRGPDWLSEAEVVVDYELIPSDQFMDNHVDYWTSAAFVATLSAAVRVVTQDSIAGARFQNVQAVAGKIADPVRPIPARYARVPPRGGGAIEIKGKFGSRPSDQRS